MFTTGIAQRRGLVGETVGISKQNARSTLSGMPRVTQMKDENQSAKRYKMAVVGDTNSKGLTIQGKFQPDDTMNSETDDYHQDFPIQYSGLGCMKFVSPVRIPVIDGDVTVNGTVTSLNPATPAPVTGLTVDFKDTIEIVDGSSNTFTKNIANTSAYMFKNDLYGFVMIDYHWDDKGGAAGALTIQGIPAFSLQGMKTVGRVFTINMNPLEVTADIIGYVTTTTDTITLEETSASAHSTVAVAASRCTNVGSIQIQLQFLVAE